MKGLLWTKLLLSFGLVLIAPVQAHCYYNPSSGRWLSRDPIGETGGPGLYALLDCNPINAIDAFGMKKCGVSWFSASYSTIPQDVGGLFKFHIDVNISFRKDRDYDPRCCKVKQLVSQKWQKPPSPPDKIDFDIVDGYSRNSNDLDPGYDVSFDYGLAQFHYEDTPGIPLKNGDNVDFSEGFVQIVYADGSDLTSRRSGGTCACENQGDIASLSHTIHGSGTFPKLNLNDTLPATVFLGVLGSN